MEADQQARKQELLNECVVAPKIFEQVVPRLEEFMVPFTLSNAAADTSPAEFARVAQAEHCIEHCLQRAKSEAGLADYEVRTWRSWHHHQTLALIATWFLVLEARRAKKKDTGDDPSADPRRYRVDPAPRLRMRYLLPHHPRARTTSPTQRTRSLAPLETT